MSNVISELVVRIVGDDSALQSTLRSLPGLYQQVESDARSAGEAMDNAGKQAQETSAVAVEGAQKATRARKESRTAIDEETEALRRQEVAAKAVADAEAAASQAASRRTAGSFGAGAGIASQGELDSIRTFYASLAEEAQAGGMRVNQKVAAQFASAMDIAHARLAELDGDTLAGLRVKFPGIAESELAQLQAVQTEIAEMNASGRASEGIFGGLFGSLLKFQVIAEIFGAISKAIGDAKDATIDYDYQTARTLRVVGPEKRPIVSAALHEGTERTGLPVDTAGEVYYQLATLLPNATDQVKAFRSEMDLLEATEGDARQTTRLTLQLIEQFPEAFGKHVDAGEKVRRANELIAISFKESAQEVGELANALKYIGPEMEALHVPLAEGLAVINTMTAEGVRGRMAGTEAGAFFNRLVKEYNPDLQGVEGKGQYKGLVAHFDDVRNAAGDRDIIATLEGIHRRYEELAQTSKKRAEEYLSIITNDTPQAMRFLGALTDETLERMRRGWEHNTNAVKGQTQEIEKMKNVMEDTFSVQSARVWSAFIGEISSALDDLARKLHIIGAMRDIANAHEAKVWANTEDAQTAYRLSHSDPVTHARDMQEIVRKAIDEVRAYQSETYGIVPGPIQNYRMDMSASYDWLQGKENLFNSEVYALKGLLNEQGIRGNSFTLGDLVKLQREILPGEMSRLTRDRVGGVDFKTLRGGPAPGSTMAQMIESFAYGLRTPEGQASCAYFASEVLQHLGKNVPTRGGAKDLADWVLGHGGTARPASEAQPGDLLHFTRNNRAVGHGRDHDAIALGDGWMIQSSDGRITRQRIRDPQHAVAISVPDHLAASAGYHGAAITRDPNAHVKKTPAEQEAATFARRMAEEQDRLNTAMDGGNQSAQAFAASLHGLTAAHKAQLTALHAHVEALNKAAEAQKKQAEIESKFHDALDVANGRIRAAQGSELSGLAKLKVEYPGVSEVRLKYLLAQQQNADAAEHEHETQDKLKNKLSEYRSELLGTTQSSDTHRLAVQLTGQAYETLSRQARALIDAISGVKAQLDASAFVQKAQGALDNARAKLMILRMPKDQQAAISSLGLGQGAEGLKAYHALSPDQQQATVQMAQQAQAADDLAEKLDKAQKAHESLLQSFAQRSEGAQASLLGDTEEAGWQKLLLTPEGKAILSEAPQKIAALRAAFGQTFQAEQRAKEIGAATEALRSFDAQMDESIAAHRADLSGQGDTAEGAFHALLGKNRALAGKLQADPDATAAAFAKFKEDFDLSRQVQSTDQFRHLLANVGKEMAVLTAGSDFARFKAQMLEIGKDGNLKQVFSDDQLKQVFAAQQKLSQVQQFADGTRSVVHKMFEDLMQGGKHFFSDMISGFTSMFEQIAANFLTNQVMNGLLGLFGGNKGGVPGIAGPTGIQIGSSGGGGGVGSIVSSLFGSAFGGFFAEGGDYDADKPFIAGERGPELILPRSAGTVMNQQQMAAAGGGGPVTVHMHVHGVQDVRGFRASGPQIAQDMHRAIKKAGMRG